MWAEILAPRLTNNRPEVMGNCDLGHNKKEVATWNITILTTCEFSQCKSAVNSIPKGIIARIQQNY